MPHASDESKDDKRRHGVHASSAEYAHYDQVHKPDYHLAESADSAESFDEEFEFATCDLGRFLNGDDGDRQLLADELGTAMRDIGFAIIEGHGIDPQLFDDAEDWVEDFFTGTELGDKMRFRAARHGAVSEGYFPIEETSDIHPDLVEGWVFGRRAFDLDGSTFDASELWPRPEFEPRFRRFVEQGTALFQPIMQAILMGLGVDPHSFDDRLDRPNFGLRLNYYPALEGPLAATEASRLLGHEDIDLFTLLPAPRVEGLQALKRDGRWARLSPPPGTIVLNTGDYMQRLSNDILPSTTHRVGRPRDPQLVRRSRVSFPLAAYLRPDELLEVLPGTGTPKYEPIKVITFHTRTTAKFYGDDYAVESPAD